MNMGRRLRAGMLACPVGCKDKTVTEVLVLEIGCFWDMYTPGIYMSCIIYTSPPPPYSALLPPPPPSPNSPLSLSPSPHPPNYRIPFRKFPSLIPFLLPFRIALVKPSLACRATCCSELSVVAEGRGEAEGRSMDWCSWWGLVWGGVSGECGMVMGDGGWRVEDEGLEGGGCRRAFVAWALRQKGREKSKSRKDRHTSGTFGTKLPGSLAACFLDAFAAMRRCFLDFAVISQMLAPYSHPYLPPSLSRPCSLPLPPPSPPAPKGPLSTNPPLSRKQRKRHKPTEHIPLLRPIPPLLFLPLQQPP